MLRDKPVAWRRIHWWIGLLTLVVFLSAGVFMRFVAHVPDLPDAERLVYRSRFLLLLMAGLANLVFPKGGPESALEQIASAIVMIAPLTLVNRIPPRPRVRSSRVTAHHVNNALFVCCSCAPRDC